MADHELLNRILRATSRLSAAELQMLLDVARRQKEEREASPPEGELCVRNPDADAANLDGLLARKI